jgi:hypothetical protein
MLSPARSHAFWHIFGRTVMILIVLLVVTGLVGLVALLTGQVGGIRLARPLFGLGFCLITLLSLTQALAGVVELVQAGAASTSGAQSLGFQRVHGAARVVQGVAFAVCCSLFAIAVVTERVPPVWPIFAFIASTLARFVAAFARAPAR